MLAEATTVHARAHRRAARGERRSWFWPAISSGPGAKAQRGTVSMASTAAAA
jgi:hypothetical protein